MENVHRSEDYFDPWNVSIHHITEETVKGSPTFDEIHGKLHSYIEGQIVMHHTAFDRIAIKRACDKYDQLEINVNWLDTAKVVRRAWGEFSQRGYGLANVVEKLNIEFQHHDALEDAIAAGKIFLEACRVTGLNVEGWIERINKPVHGRPVTPDKLAGNPEGEYFGQKMVFTGALSILRREAANLAANGGFNVAPSVTIDTSVLVVGIQDKDRLKGYEKSSKHRKVEGLIDKGYDIQIISEADFMEMIHVIQSEK